MSKAVVFARAVKPEWLDQTVLFLMETTDRSVLREKLNEYLGQNITSSTVLRKTREILLNMWVDYDGDLVAVRDRAIEIFKTCPRTEKMAIHWAMMLLAFPIFKDLAVVIGKLADTQNEISTAQIKRRIFEVWGERTTLLHSLAKNIQTLKDCGILNSPKAGIYQVNRREIKDPDVACLLVYAVVKANEKLYQNIAGIDKFKELFPFEINLTIDDLSQSGLFKIDRIGGEPVVSI